MLCLLIGPRIFVLFFKFWFSFINCWCFIFVFLDYWFYGYFYSLLVRLAGVWVVWKPRVRIFCFVCLICFDVPTNCCEFWSYSECYFVIFLGDSHGFRVAQLWIYGCVVGFLLSFLYWVCFSKSVVRVCVWLF